MNRGIAQLASVLAWGASGRAFESHYSDQKTAFKAVFFVIYLTLSALIYF